jgi:hypothetical protein
MTPLEHRAELSAIDVFERVLDKGIVIDSWARLSVLGIDLMTTVEARVVVASIETYVLYAGAISTSGVLAGRMVPCGAVKSLRPD